MKLPMSFFDIRKSGDIIQRMADHGRIRSFLTSQLLGVILTVISLLVFSITLLIYSRLIFAVFLGMSIVYTLWVVLFLHRRRIIDYESFAARFIRRISIYIAGASGCNCGVYSLKAEHIHIKLMTATRLNPASAGYVSR